MSKLQVAVIGAGAAGLVTARELQRQGHQATVLEQSARVGGVWVYSPQTETDPLGQSGARIHGSLYASLRTNLPRDLMAFVDYPFDSSGGGADDWPRFPGHAQVLAYLERFARDFGLLQCIRFDTSVAAVRPGGPEGGWLVEATTAGESWRQRFDAVAVCNGHYSEPRVPEIPGLAEFPGQLLHSHNYREPSPFAGKRVALLGASASALDLSAEIAGVAEAVYCCAEAFSALPEGARVTGKLQRLPGIETLGADGSIRLQDGQSLEPVDALMFCTGYRYAYPFFDDGLVRVADNWVSPLYQDLLHIDRPSLAFIGIPFRVVPFPLFELQAQWFARLLAGRFALPSPADMRVHTAARIAALRAAGVKQRHFHQRSLDCYDYLDALAEQSGAAPPPAWQRQLIAALLAHIAANLGVYRDRPFPAYAPTRIPQP
ncbi:MAG: FAD-dependent oxidoreductase [Pseudomonadales bacterium]